MLASGRAISLEVDIEKWPDRSAVTSDFMGKELTDSETKEAAAWIFHVVGQEVAKSMTPEQLRATAQKAIDRIKKQQNEHW